MRKLLIALFAACLFVPSAAFAQPKGKPIVAIYQMDDVARTGQADTFSRMIETAITTTNKFRVIERSRMGVLVGEQARGRAGLVTTNRPGRIGGFEGADFLIYGSITSVSVGHKADFGATFLSGMLSGNNNSRQSCTDALATLSVDIKITDANSGEVRYASRIDQTQKSAASCSGEAGIDTASLMRGAAEKIAMGLITTIYPIQIAAAQEDGTLVLNYGEGSVALGATMGVFSKGASIVDPATGEVLGSNETLLGLIRVTDVQSRFSKAQAITEFPARPPVGSIVRAATQADIDKFKPHRGRR